MNSGLSLAVSHCPSQLRFGPEVNNVLNIARRGKRIKRWEENCRKRKEKIGSNVRNYEEEKHLPIVMKLDKLLL